MADSTDETRGPADRAARPKAGARAAVRRWTPARRQKFLQRLAETANIAAACRAAQMPRWMAYRERRKSDPFRKAWDEAMETALDDLESALLERATRGVEKAVFFGGKECGTVRHYSDALAMFLLKARRPETYGRPGEAREEGAGEAGLDARALIEARLARLRGEGGEAD